MLLDAAPTLQETPIGYGYNMNNTAYRTPYTPAPGLMAHIGLKSLPFEATDNLEESAPYGDTWGMDTNSEKPPLSNRSLIERDSQHGDVDLLRENSETIDAMASFINLGERVSHAVENSHNKGQTAADLARAIGVSHTTLISMQEKVRETSRNWDAIRRLAINTGWSYEWLRNGKGKQPVRMTDEEAAALERELSGKAATPEPVAAPHHHAAERTAPYMPGDDAFAPVDFFVLYDLSNQIMRTEFNSQRLMPPHKLWYCAVAYYNACRGKPDPTPEKLEAFLQSLPL